MKVYTETSKNLEQLPRVYRRLLGSIVEYKGNIGYVKEILTDNNNENIHARILLPNIQGRLVQRKATAKELTKIKQELVK